MASPRRLAIGSALAAAVLLAGCAGGGAGLAATGLAVLACLGLAACRDGSPDDGVVDASDTNARDVTPDATATDTSATDAIDGDGLDAGLADADANDADGCSGYWQNDCRGGRWDPVCCPAGMACNYGWGARDCGDGRCVWPPDTCEGADVIDTRDDVVAPGDAIDDADANEPGDAIEDADVGCDGAWESACREGRIVQLCCPAGLACNYGQTMVDCGDGTCVEMPATCPR